jgi:membrane protein DedA with SNARE-associated domain
MLEFFQTYSYLGLFLMLTLEEGGLPFPIPGDLFIAAVAFMPNSNYILIVAVVIASTLFGSTFLFSISRKFGMPILLKVSGFLRIKKVKIEKVQKLFKKHEKTAIILGRLTPGFRTITPMVAGTFKVSYKIFWANTVIAALIWANIYYVIGKFFGGLLSMLIGH